MPFIPLHRVSNGNVGQPYRFVVASNKYGPSSDLRTIETECSRFKGMVTLDPIKRGCEEGIFTFEGAQIGHGWQLQTSECIAQ